MVTLFHGIIRKPLPKRALECKYSFTKIKGNTGLPFKFHEAASEMYSYLKFCLLVYSSYFILNQDLHNSHVVFSFSQPTLESLVYVNIIIDKEKIFFHLFAIYRMSYTVFRIN